MKNLSMSREKHEICDILIVNSPLTTNQFLPQNISWKIDNSNYNSFMLCTMKKKEF